MAHFLNASDSVNQGMSTAKRRHASLYDWIVYKRGSKARERKGEEGERRSEIYTIFDHMTATVRDLSDTVRNCPPFSTSAVTLNANTTLHFQHAFFLQQTMQGQSNEARVILAIKAIRSSKKISRRAAAKLYNVPEITIRNRMNG